MTPTPEERADRIIEVVDGEPSFDARGKKVASHCVVFTLASPCTGVLATGYTDDTWRGRPGIEEIASGIRRRIAAEIREAVEAREAELRAEHEQSMTALGRKCDQYEADREYNARLVEELRVPMPCGHPKACEVAGATALRPRMYCFACVREQKLIETALARCALISDKHWSESGHVRQAEAVSCAMSISVLIRRLTVANVLSEAGVLENEKREEKK